jgi:undecaprenyl-diphosphatase
MTFLQALILGIIQGITEFLPISSSGHLVLTPFLFGWNIPPEQKFPFDVLVQVGTLVAVFAYFRNDIRTILQDFSGGWFKERRSQRLNRV